jgi:hypothetical protein
MLVIFHSLVLPCFLYLAQTLSIWRTRCVDAAAAPQASQLTTTIPAPVAGASEAALAAQPFCPFLWLFPLEPVDHMVASICGVVGLFIA